MRPLVAVVALLALAGCAATPAEKVDQFDGSWVLESATDAAGAFELDPEHPVTLEFGEATGGTAACNQYGVTLLTTATGVTASDLSQTEMACEPASVMEIESRYLAALAAVDDGSSGEELVLRGPEIELVFTPAEPVAALPLVGTTWALVTIVDTTDPDAAASSPIGAPTLLLGENDRITVVTGCNGISGSYEISGTTVTTGSLNRTLMGCELELSEQEMLLGNLVEGAFEVEQPETLNIAQLIVTSRDGSIVANFTAKP
jgi:heat shock protein HslJ